MATAIDKTTKFDGRGYPDLRDHLRALKDADLLYAIDEPVNKDTELMPLVRWQFRGGIPEAQRKAFLFTNLTNSQGRTYDLPLVVGAMAATRAIYAIGMGVPVDQIGDHWKQALASPAAPVGLLEALVAQQGLDDLHGVGGVSGHGCGLRLVKRAG